MNLTSCKETPFKAVYERVEALAAERGIQILESELIGLAPKCAFAGTKPEKLKMVNFSKDRLLETHLKEFASA